MASSPGHAGRPNEDFVGAVPGAVVLLDGAGIPGTDAICRHGVAWYSHALGTMLLERLSSQDGTGLVAALADSIERVAGLHRHTCDLADPSSPQSTVAITRFTGVVADYLVLADAFAVLDSSGSAPRVVTDPREVRARDECSSLLRGLTTGTADHERAQVAAREALRARRNQPGGYWIAKDDPDAAGQAVTGSVPLDHLAGVALLSNGASRIVDPYRLAGWPAVLDLIRAHGPEEIVRRVRGAERDAGRDLGRDDAREVGATASGPGAVRPDDATVAHAEPDRDRGPSG